MDESDSDTDAGDMYEQDELFPLEGKFKDAAEKAEIMAMPEIQREELLADRAQVAERDRQTRALRQLLNAREAGKNKEKKRKAGTANLDGDEKRKTSRQRTKVGGGRVGESSSGIDSLKRARAEKSDRQRRRQEDKDRYGDTHGNGRSYSEDDASGESDVEWDDSRAKHASPSPPPKDAPLAELRDVNRVRTGRSQFAKVCFYPGFEEAITGCFARVSVGPSPDTGENIYRMALIKGMYDIELLFQLLTCFRLRGGKAICNGERKREADHHKSIYRRRTWQDDDSSSVHPVLQFTLHRGLYFAL